MQTDWDRHHTPESLEQWLYGAASLGGATRTWFVDQVRNWPSGLRFLDAGCGGGVTAYQLAEAGLLEQVRYVGVDVTRSMLDLAARKTKHPNVTWVHSPLVDYRDEEAFDRVLLRAVLAHLDDPVPTLRHVLGLVRPGGLLYIVFWNNPVQGQAIRAPSGWREIPDNAHGRELLIGAIEDAGHTLADELQIEERSARGKPHRDVWIVRHAG